MVGVVVVCLGVCVGVGVWGVVCGAGVCRVCVWCVGVVWWCLACRCMVLSDVVCGVW